MSPNWTNDAGSCAPCHDEARGGSPCFIHHTKPPPKRRRVAKPTSPPSDLDELDALHAAATAGPRRMVFAVRAYEEWHEFSARLRAAEAEVERLRGALRGMLRAHPNCHAVDCGGYGCDDDYLTDDPDGDTGGDIHVCVCGAIAARNAARAALGET